MNKPAVISLFTGAMGFDLGFEMEGFEIRVAVDNDPWAEATIKANRPALPVISEDIHTVPTWKILETADLKEGEATVLTGAPPCEPFSTAGKRNGSEDHRAHAAFEFIRVINEVKPLFFVFEEVPGFLSAAKKHISFYDRVAMQPEDLAPEEALGSFFKEVFSAFEETGYTLLCNVHTAKESVLNAADYGVPQKRKRFILIGARDGEPVELPKPTHGSPHSVEVLEGELLPWVTLREALQGLDNGDHEHRRFPWWGRYLQYISPGGCWRDLPPELQQEALGGAYDNPSNARTKGKKGGRTGFLRRLSWDRPAPTIVDSPTTRGGCLCHPEEDRPLSVQEYGRLQGFPDDWIIKGPLPARYQLIGQATPVPLAQAIARTLRKAEASHAFPATV